MKFTCLIVFGMLTSSAFRSNAQEDDTTKYKGQKPLYDFEIKKPTFQLSKEQKSNKNRHLRFSVLTGYREGVDGVAGLANFGVYPDAETGTRRFYMFNLSIQDILTHGFYKSNNVILEVKDPSKYRYDPKYGSEREWIKKNTYCFEFLVPANAVSGVKTLNDELSHVFNVKFGRERRLVKVLVLFRTSKRDKLRSRGEGNSVYDLHGNFNNKPINQGRFGEALYLAGMPSVIDETNYNDSVDMYLNISDWTNLSAVRKALKNYDLDLKEDMQEQEVFVIKELN